MFNQYTNQSLCWLPGFHFGKTTGRHCAKLKYCSVNFPLKRNLCVFFFYIAVCVHIKQKRYQIFCFQFSLCIQLSAKKENLNAPLKCIWKHRCLLKYCICMKHEHSSRYYLHTCSIRTIQTFQNELLLCYTEQTLRKQPVEMTQEQ